MRRVSFLLVSGAVLLPASPAFAADELKFGPPPAWVVPQAVPPAPAKTERPVALLLHDQQTLLERGKISTYSEIAFKILKPEGLDAGNLSLGWNPATDTVTVNKVEIRRGDRVIDVLAAGQKFTTMRRESNLELAMLDGMLTANIQPEGLQVGDVVILTTTVDHSDPVLKGHVETVFAPWASAEIARAHARLAWPSNIDLKIQKTGDLPAPQQTTRDGHKDYELTMLGVQPVIAPKGAPVRYGVGRMGEATDFRSWADAAALMSPLYRDAAVIPASGPLRDEVEKIRKAAADPKGRAELALQMVEQRVRYVALLVGQGGFVPASAETTWSRRFGDCKAKTTLLLAILHEMGIDAEPVLVNTRIGDAIADRLPTIGLFDHVLVRAHIGGKAYWLDGTRTSDTRLDDIRTPNFGWGLPLVANAALIHLVPDPARIPDSERRIMVDATAGIYAPAKVEIDEVYRGDGAAAIDHVYSQLSTDQRSEVLRQNAKKYFNSINVDSATATLDQATHELHVSTKGTAKLEWRDGWFNVPSTSIGYNADFGRIPGPQQQAPFATDFPSYDVRHVSIRVPASLLTNQEKLPTPVKETVGGVEYSRSLGIKGDTLTVDVSERTITPEITYKEALAAQSRLRALNDDDVYLRLPAGYRATAKDLDAMMAETPGSAKDYFERGLALLQAGRQDEAVSDFTAAIGMDGNNAWYFANRGIAYAWKQDAQAAEKDLASAEKLDAGNPVVARARGLLAEQRGDFKAAADAYAKSLVREPKNDFALTRQAGDYVAIGQYDQALAVTDQLLKLRKDAKDRALRASIYSAQGNREAGVKEAEQIVAEHPDSIEGLVIAANAFANLGKRAEADATFDKALRIKPVAFIYLNRANSRLLSDTAGRIADLDAALKLEPSNLQALAMKADALQRGGKAEEAVALYDQALKGAPKDPELPVARAIALYRAGRSKEAAEALAALHSKATTANQLNNLCWEKATARIMLDSAVQECRDAVKLQPGDGAIMDSLGMALLQSGKLDEALAAYDKAIERRTGAQSLMGRAMVYSRKGDRARAETDADAARKLYPKIDDLFAGYGLKL